MSYSAVWDMYVGARNSLIDGVNGYIKEKQLGRFLPPIISRTLDQFIEKLDRNIDPQNRTVEARFLTYSISL